MFDVRVKEALAPITVPVVRFSQEYVKLGISSSGSETDAEHSMVPW